MIKPNFSRRFFRFGAACALAAGAAFAPGAAAEDYPAKPIRVIVPFGPGGGSDTTARLTAQELHRALGQPFVVENRPGAGALIGTKALVESAPDGYTIMISTSSWLTSAALHKPAFDPVNNVAPIADFAYNPYALAVHPALPAGTTKAFIALARSRPDDLAYGHPGVGSITHLSMIYFMQLAKIRMLGVPYKSGGAVMPDVMSGRTQAILSGFVNVVPHVHSRKLRVLGVSTSQRLPDYPAIPALREVVPGYVVLSWYGVIAPKGTPAAIVDRLNAAINKVAASPEFRKAAKAQGLTVTGGHTVENMRELIRADYARWSKLVADAGITAE